MAGAKSHCYENDDGMPAHTVAQPVESGPFGKKRIQHIIVLCNRWFDLPTTSGVINNVESNPNVYLRNNANIMILQGELPLVPTLKALADKCGQVRSCFTKCFICTMNPLKMRKGSLTREMEISNAVKPKLTAQRNLSGSRERKSMVWVARLKPRTTTYFTRFLAG